MFTVQRNTFTPTGKPVMVVKGEVVDVIVPPPLTKVHVPVAGAGAGLAAMVTEAVVLQMLWSGPAAAVAAPPLKTRIVTSSKVAGPQGPLFTVQRNTFVPTDRPVMVVVGEDGFVIVPVPLVRVQVPVAGKINELPAMVVELAGEHRL